MNTNPMQTLWLTPALKVLVNDAVAAGFTATSDGNSITIKRGRGVFDHKLPARGVYIALTERHTFDYAYRIDTDASLTLTIRTIKAARVALGI